VWVEILVFIMNSKYDRAAVLALIGAFLSAIGLIHAPSLSLFYNPSYMFGYLVIAVVFLYYHHVGKNETNELPSD